VNQSTEVQSIQNQLGSLDKLVTRLLLRAAREKGDRAASILDELSELSNSVSTLKLSVVNHLQVRQRQFGALVGVGSAINSSLGLKRVLNEVMDALVSLMGAERGFLMLRETNGEMKVQTARGMDQVDIGDETLAISNTIVQHVTSTGEAIMTTNAQSDPRFGQQLSVTVHHLLSILCAPLKIKDDLIGVIYVDNRIRMGMFQQSDLELMSAFANQAAVAIDNARLFDDLQESNAELEKAYQATLEGWVRALDYRDKETEGHTQRVTTLTERLARFIGIHEDELIHIRRGALLHDIGKMAIPDGILLKPGGLTGEEREIIQRHPVYAHEMLSPIKFLVPALDIPYCHHEKWDGSGYPRGLKGEKIPFSARIFAVVDVWDALISDRPYRRGIPPAEVLQSIREKAGNHFDSRVVDAFLEMKDYSV